jgi:hypothetical protein
MRWDASGRVRVAVDVWLWCAESRRGGGGGGGQRSNAPLVAWGLLQALVTHGNLVYGLAATDPAQVGPHYWHYTREMWQVGNLACYNRGLERSAAYGWQLASNATAWQVLVQEAQRTVSLASYFL